MFLLAPQDIALYYKWSTYCVQILKEKCSLNVHVHNDIDSGVFYSSGKQIVFK